MKRYGLEILPILAAALVLSGCGGAGEKANGSNSAGTTAPASVNAATPVSTASVTPASTIAVTPTPLATPLPTGDNTSQPGTPPGSGTRNTNNAPPTQMPTAKIGSGGNDFYLFTQARAAINADAELKGANVILDVKEGIATLSGTVANAEQKSKAERLVREVGLKTVRNQLRVSAGK